MKSPQHGNILHVFFSMYFLVLLSSPAMPRVEAQSNNSDPQLATTRVSPSMAIIIVVLVVAVFFMGFFSIYIRNCSDPNSNNSVRNVLSMNRRRANAASRGLDQAMIESFPTFSYAEVKDHKIGKGALECAVCLNEFKDDETLRLIPKCDHVFHPECIDSWLESHVTCPVCRANLSPQPGDESLRAMSNPENQETGGERQENDAAVAVQVVCDDPPERQEQVRPEVNRNYSFNMNRPPRAGSIRSGRGVFVFGRFRSHTTGHSLVQPGENVERFTLRLPEEKRKEMMDRAMLNRAKSYAVHLPRDRSSRRGYRISGDEESSRDSRSNKKIEPAIDRWIFARAPSFFSRALSIRSPRVTAGNGEGSTSKTEKEKEKATVKMPSFKRLEPKGDSARPPV